MSAYRWAWLCLGVLVAGCKTAPPPPPPPEIDFREELRPYGQFLIVAPFGKVWAPNPEIVGKNFVPYVTNGQWKYSKKDGWDFSSGYKFGDIVFHYGRWVHVQSLDWLWVEDKQKGPAWVDWKTSSEYVGWAPMLPSNTQGQQLPQPDFFYVRARHFAQPEIEKFRVTGDDLGHAVDQTQPLKAAPGAPPGPPVDLIVSERGLERDAQGNLRIPELPPATPAVEEAPAPAPEPEPAPPPPPPDKKKKKKKHK